MVTTTGFASSTDALIAVMGRCLRAYDLFMDADEGTPGEGRVTDSMEVLWSLLLDTVMYDAMIAGENPFSVVRRGRFEMLTGGEGDELTQLGITPQAVQDA